MILNNHCQGVFNLMNLLIHLFLVSLFDCFIDLNIVALSEDEE
jgi:hypothetical protein